jgi:hypothetical protein
MLSTTWGPGPFDNEYAVQAAPRLTQPIYLRSELAEAIHNLRDHPGNPQLIGYAAAEIVAAAGATRPYWQSDVLVHPARVAGHEGTGLSFYIPPAVDQWIRERRPVMPLEIILDALELVRGLSEHCDLWPDEDDRRWYLDATRNHLESALERAGRDQAARDAGDDEPF